MTPKCATLLAFGDDPPELSSTTRILCHHLVGGNSSVGRRTHQVALPASEATAPGPQTASIEYSGIDNSYGVLSGGRQRDFTTGLYGWQGAAFASLGMMGIEWTTATGTEARLDFSPDSGTASPSPGGDSSWTAPGYLSANPNNLIYTNNTISISGNQARFSQRHRSLSDESAINRRLYWVAELAPGYDPVFSGAGPPPCSSQTAQGRTRPSSFTSPVKPDHPSSLGAPRCTPHWSMEILLRLCT